MFGLSQLHQLRGRIGRSGDESYCFLIVPDDLEGEAKERINSFLRFDDGFILSEIDLRIRGPGEFLGLRQHGHLNFKMGDIIKNKDILLKAKRQAEAVLEKDPNLSLPENKIILSNIYEEDKIFLTSIG
jgi:ATP-dependent DNA helicase RecG